MVDLSIATSYKFWQNFADGTVFRVIALLESVEDALPDRGEAFEAAMQSLSEAMGRASPETIRKPEAFVGVVAYLKTSRYLRLLQATDEIKPGTASGIIGYAERNVNDNTDCRVFINRNVVFERFRLLSRVLSPDRLRLLAESLEDE